jgi:hypothetical protein
MRLTEIPLSEVFQARNWVLTFNSEADVSNPLVSEAHEFGPQDMGLFSAVCKFADGSEHPALVWKDFANAGEGVKTYVFTRVGWLDIMADGFFRAVGKYRHDIFPFDVFIASPDRKDQEIGANADAHRKVWSDALPKLKQLKYEPLTTRRRNAILPPGQQPPGPPRM